MQRFALNELNHEWQMLSAISVLFGSTEKQIILIITHIYKYETDVRLLFELNKIAIKKEKKTRKCALFSVSCRVEVIIGCYLSLWLHNISSTFRIANRRLNVFSNFKNKSLNKNTK